MPPYFKEFLREESSQPAPLHEASDLVESAQEDRITWNETGKYGFLVNVEGVVFSVLKARDDTAKDVIFGFDRLKKSEAQRLDSALNQVLKERGIRYGMRMGSSERYDYDQETGEFKDGPQEEMHGYELWEVKKIDRTWMSELLAAIVKQYKINLAKPSW